jgi:predicted DNA-binding transcriptional regulator AlpA
MTHHPNRTIPADTPRRGRRPSTASSDHPHARKPAREQLTIPEVCAELKVSRSTFYYWRQTGKAPRCLVLPNREVRIARHDLESWLDAHIEDEA